ncbi:hypothetical protein [Lelliottia amnigena]|uniref:hypothetical protein n=1 Tax=Lelliottia amnigena TaxID=61646 RepID=UPI001C5CA4D5|nr:hypothetical protein [Lelliottia amnigena]QXZ21796.1 hypothetical protein I6L75_21610 [Lelliottia amnigena]
MKESYILDELIILARLSQLAYHKPLKYIDAGDKELIERFRKTFSPELIEQLCLRIQELEAKL